MSESPTLRECIEAAVGDWCASTGGGMVTAFVGAVEYIGEDGATMLCIATPAGQPTHRSMGLAKYLDAWFEEDAFVRFSELREGDGE